MEINAQLSDPELIDAFRHGAASAGDELTRRYYHRVAGLSMQYLRDPHDSQDVAQEVFYKIIACRKIMNFRGEAQLWTWIYRITMNACRTHQHRKQRAKLVDLERCSHETACQIQSWIPEQVALAQEMRNQLAQVLQHLPLKYQKALRITCLENRSCGEAAKILHLPVSTLRVHINRGKGLLIRLFRSKIRDGRRVALDSAIPDMIRAA